MTTDELIVELALAPHPEGGFYRQTWVDEHSSAIYYLLPGTGWAAWHRVHDRVEIWHFYAGAPLQLAIADDVTELGPEVATGQRPQVVVPPGAWQRARSLGEWSLVGCTVTPPFTFDAFELRP